LTQPRHSYFRLVLLSLQSGKLVTPSPKLRHECRSLAANTLISRRVQLKLFRVALLLV